MLNTDRNNIAQVTLQADVIDESAGAAFVLFESSNTKNVLTGPIRKTLFSLALPVLAEQLLNTFVGVFDTYLAGRISPAATTAVGLGAYVGWLASLLGMLVGTGTTALVSRHVGGGDRAKANHFANQSLALGGILGLIILAGMYSLAPWFASTAGMKGETYEIAVTYLRVDAFGHMLLSVTLVGCAALRGAGNMRTPMFIFLLMNVVNAAASWTLTYGAGPIPKLGVNGIVAGTLTAYIVGVVVTLYVYARGDTGLKLHLHELPLTWSLTRRILRIGVPAAADGLIMWIGQFTFISIIARLAAPPLGELYLAAHIIAVRVEALTYLPAVAWGTASATMVGQALGAENPLRARKVGKEAVLQCGLLSLGIALLFFFGAEGIYSTMSRDPRVGEIGAAPFRILACLQPLLVVSIVLIGSLRGAGDTRFPLLITIVGALLIRVPLGYIGGVVLHGGLLGAWAGMFGDMTWRAFAATLRYFKGGWTRTRV